METKKLDSVLSLESLFVKLPPLPIHVAKLLAKLEYEFFEHKKFIIVLSIVIPVEIFIAVLYCIFVGVHNIKEWEYITKPLPMVLLIGTTFSCIVHYGFNRFRGLILTAFVLSLIADIVLIPDGDIYFLGGLGIFLLAHVFYIIAFSVSPNSNSPHVQLNFKRAVPFILMFLVVPPVLAFEMLKHGHPIEMIVAVVIYSGVLGSMGWRTAARIGYPSETLSSQVVALVGVIFFMCSDLLLAVNRFHTKIPLSQVWILPTYWIAQTLIAISLQRTTWAKEKKDKEEEILKTPKTLKFPIPAN